MFFCTECGSETAKWSGKCPACGAWNSLKEVESIIGKKKLTTRNFTSSPAQSLPSIKPESIMRTKIGIKEFDGVLGGGIVSGMVVIVGGEPGVGKSTLLLQVAGKCANEKKKVLYIAGEESKEQIFLRSDRIGQSQSEILISSETNLNIVSQQIEKFTPDLLIVDSIQSVFVEHVDSSPGSISQLKESTYLLTKLAKQKKIPVFIIGHITKDGYVAGPKIIEHMVDTVLYFENEQHFRILRATKNRFGSTNEIGIFEMQTSGLQEVENPSLLFVNDTSYTHGSAIGSILEGTRAFISEVQALVSPANYGTSQRVALGFDHRKLAVLIAVLEKHLSINLRNNDIFVKLSGGMKTIEPALELAIIASIISSFRERKIVNGLLFMGEVGLNGEIRPVQQMQKRLKEAKKLGFSKAIVSSRTTNFDSSFELIKIKNIREIMPYMLEK